MRMSLRPVGVAALAFALTTLLPVPAVGQRAEGKLVGLFTITGAQCKHDGRLGPCEDAMSGVVKLTGPTGGVVRIRVDGKNPLDLRLKSGRFSRRLAPGKYQISDRVNARRGGGSCPVFLTGPSFKQTGSLNAITTVTADSGEQARIRINCFGH